MKGVQELEEPPLPAGRVRRPGGGRPALVERDPDLPRSLEALVEPLTRGDPESPLRWTSKSTRALAAELAAQDHPVSHEKVAQLLRQMDYSLQGNRKTEEGNDHPDRDAERRSAVAAREVAAPGEGSRLSGSLGAARVSVWHLRLMAKHGLRECRHRP